MLIEDLTLLHTSRQFYTWRADWRWDEEVYSAAVGWWQRHGGKCRQPTTHTHTPKIVLAGFCETPQCEWHQLYMYDGGGVCRRVALRLSGVVASVKQYDSLDIVDQAHLRGIHI